MIKLKCRCSVGFLKMNGGRTYTSRQPVGLLDCDCSSGRMRTCGILFSTLSFIGCKFSKHTSTYVLTAFSTAQSFEDMLNDQRGLVQSISDLIDGFGENLKTMYTESDVGVRQQQLLRAKPSSVGQSFDRNDITRKPLGRNVRKVTVNGETKFSVRKVGKVAGRIGDALSSIVTFLAPIFLIGDLIWGDDSENK